MATAIPIFRIFDYNKMLEYYIDWMGFTIDWENKPANYPIYMQVSLNGIVIHLSEHSGDCSPGARIHITDFPELKEFHRLLIDKDYKYNKPGLRIHPFEENAWWMDAIDPFGNRLTFTGPM